MALNEKQKEDLMEALKHTEFPVVVHFCSMGGPTCSDWAPELCMSKSGLIDFLDSDECPEWEHSAGATGTRLFDAYEYVHDLSADKKYWQALDNTIDECLSEHVDFDLYMSGAGWDWDGEGHLVPEEWDDED